MKHDVFVEPMNFDLLSENMSNIYSTYLRRSADQKKLHHHLIRIHPTRYVYSAAVLRFLHFVSPCFTPMSPQGVGRIHQQPVWSSGRWCGPWWKDHVKIPQDTPNSLCKMIQNDTLKMSFFPSKTAYKQPSWAKVGWSAIRAQQCLRIRSTSGCGKRDVRGGSQCPLCHQRLGSVPWERWRLVILRFQRFVELPEVPCWIYLGVYKS